MFRVLLLAGAGVCLLPAAPLDRLLSAVQDRYNGARTLSVQFRESYQMQGHPRPPEAGTLTLRKQGRMRWDYSQPAGKIFVSDGKMVYLYTSRDNRVEKIPIKDTEDMRAPLAFLLGHLDFRKEFKDFGSRPADGGEWLDASAKSARLPYEKIQMLVAEDNSIRELKIVGRDGSAVDFVFTDERLNPPVADSLFRFTIPPGAEVVNALEYGIEGK